MTRHEKKQHIYEQFARISKALSSPARLELLDLLTQGERSVDELATESTLSIANASQHLQVLHGARLVDSRRAGQRIIYRLAGPSVEALLQALRHTAEEELAELDQVAREYLEGRDDFEPIERAELVERLKKGSCVLIDVRPRREFEAEHLEGAVSVPLEDLDAFARKAPQRKTIVAYCRGPYCVFALDAVKRLRKRGLDAIRCEDGVSEWRLAGLPTRSASAEGGLA